MQRWSLKWQCRVECNTFVGVLARKGGWLDLGGSQVAPRPLAGRDGLHERGSTLKKVWNAALYCHFRRWRCAHLEGSSGEIGVRETVDAHLLSKQWPLQPSKSIPFWGRSGCETI